MWVIITATKKKLQLMSYFLPERTLTYIRKKGERGESIRIALFFYLDLAHSLYSSSILVLVSSGVETRVVTTSFLDPEGQKTTGI